MLSTMDIETIDPARHVGTMTALLEADELVTCLLLAIDEIKRQVAKTPNTRRQFGFLDLIDHELQERVVLQ